MTVKYDPLSLIGTRVELAPHLDQWMQGDRYGEIVAYTMSKSHLRVKLDKSGKTIRVHGGNLNPI